MKVDCEGSELDIFQTIDKEYLKSKVKKIAVEYHSLSIKHNLLDLLSEYFSLENLESAEETKEIGMLYFYNKNFYSF
jgi:hypothetical protein